MEKLKLPRQLSRKGKKKRAGAAMAVPAVCLALLVILIGAAIGRYMHQINSAGSVRAKEFYFTSDFLDGEKHTLAPGSGELTFTLGNHADELRYSEVDIAYVVTVTDADGKTSTATVECKNSNQKLAKDKKEDNEVTISGLESGHTYTVTAVGTGGYEKTLTATIEVLPGETAVYKYLETNSDYVLLTVWAQGYTGDVTITPPAELIPDNTDPVMGTVKTGESFTDTTSFSNDSYASHTYRFFGSAAVVTADSFAVTYGADNTAAEVKDPG